MKKKHAKKLDIINGRISLLFFGLLLFAGVLWLERLARYRYDLIFRPMLIWLLPVLFGLTVAAFAVLMILWLKDGKKKDENLVDLRFFMALTIPLMAAFLFPWLTLFTTGLQFFRLATELVFYAALGGYAGYIGYHKVGSSAALLAGTLTLNILALTYYYERFLSPSSFILNTEEFGYLDGWIVALMLIAAVVAGNLLALLINRKQKVKLHPWAVLLHAGLTVVLLAVNAIFSLSILLIRIMIFGGITFMIAWYIAWCIHKKRKKN